MAEIPPLPVLSIQAHYVRCEYRFEKLSQLLDRVLPNNYNDMVVDEMGRFRVWATHAGAHQTGEDSLDYRLREALHIHKRVAELLEELSEGLEDGRLSIAPIFPKH